MKRFRVHGEREPLDSKSAIPDFPPNLRHLVTLKHSASVQRARASHPPLQFDDLYPDDLIQLELDQGMKLWVRADDLESDFGLTPSRGSAGDVVELPNVLPLGAPSRGIVGNWVIKGFKVFGLDPVGATTDLIKDKVEGALKPGPGLYRWEGKESSDYTRIKSLEKERTDKPWLVFIHGTASSTEGSFGGLWEGGTNARMVQLLGHYPKRVLAFQHRTLSHNPMQNALELAGYFPKGARLHLVSHSRGGLMGELLCRSMMEGRFPFDQDDLQIFAQPDRKDDLKQLEQLGHLLQQKQFVIERFVRVGCPARGTTFASGRLDRYLSIILNVVAAIPGLKGNPVLEGLSAFLLGVVKNRTKPEELPGLEAQMPASPLVRILNRPGVRTRADLHILGADLAGEENVRRLKTFVTDLFYREDHDLVVNTPAMFGGTERIGEVRYWIDTGKEVDHFHYFRNPDTANRLLQALTQEESHALFHRLEREPSEVTEDDYRIRAVGSPQPVVYVLPGTMGSHLRVGKDRVWLDKWDLAMGGLMKLKSTAKNVVADQPIGSGCKDLIRYLANSHTVKPFAYDWRKSLIELADRFRKDLEETVKAQEAVGQPVRIVAHSMGGLVVRVMIATEEGKKVWDRMCRHPGTRFIMLGTPNGGSHAITAMLMGRDPLVRMLDLLDITNSQSTLLGIISRFDGILQLLPHNGTFDFYQAETWRSFLEHDRDRARGVFGAKVVTSNTAGIEWPVPDAAQLAEAFKVQQLLQASPIDPQRMIYVAGRAAVTPEDIRIDSSERSDRQILVRTTSSGDGRVPWATGIPEALKHRTYYVDCEHGGLANFPEAFGGLGDLLHNGTTSKLSQTPLVPPGVDVVSQNETALSEIYDGRVEMYPEEEDLIASALGSTKKIEVHLKKEIRNQKDGLANPWHAQVPLEEVTERHLIGSLPYEPLFERSWSREILAAVAAKHVIAGRVDTKQLVRKVAQGLPIEVIPRLPNRTLKHGVQLLIDNGIAMEPFRRDQMQLVEILKAVVGESQVDELSFSECPNRGCLDWERERKAPYRLPAPGTPVVVLSDMGLGGPFFHREKSTVSEWVKLATQLGQLDCPFIALLPYPESRWVAQLTQFIVHIQWDRVTSLRRVLEILR